MIEHQIHIRVRYGETDQMGILYYGNYAQYYELGRVEALRNLGLVYRDMEKNHGIMLPVYEVRSRFLAPAYYDQNLRLVTQIREKPGTRIRFFHDLFSPEGKHLHSGEVTLVFYDSQKKRPIHMPPFVEKIVAPHFE